MLTRRLHTHTHTLSLYLFSLNVFQATLTFVHCNLTNCDRQIAREMSIASTFKAKIIDREHHKLPLNDGFLLQTHRHIQPALNTLLPILDLRRFIFATLVDSMTELVQLCLYINKSRKQFVREWNICEVICCCCSFKKLLAITLHKLQSPARCIA